MSDTTEMDLKDKALLKDKDLKDKEDKLMKVDKLKPDKAKPGKKKKAPATSSSVTTPLRQRGNKRKGHETYNHYIFKVLKQVHPKMRISRKAMEIMNSCVNDAFERVATEAGKLVRMTKSSTMTSREIQSAVRLVFPGELSKHAISEGTKAVNKFVHHV